MAINGINSSFNINRNVSFRREELGNRDVIQDMTTSDDFEVSTQSGDSEQSNVNTETTAKSTQSSSISKPLLTLVTLGCATAATIAMIKERKVSKEYLKTANELSATRKQVEKLEKEVKTYTDNTTHSITDKKISDKTTSNKKTKRTHRNSKYKSKGVEEKYKNIEFEKKEIQKEIQKEESLTEEQLKEQQKQLEEKLKQQIKKEIKQLSLLDRLKIRKKLRLEIERIQKAIAEKETELATLDPAKTENKEAINKLKTEIEDLKNSLIESQDFYNESNTRVASIIESILDFFSGKKFNIKPKSHNTTESNNETLNTGNNIHWWNFKAKKEARIKEIQQKFEAAKAKLQEFDKLTEEQKAANKEYKAAKAEFDMLQAELSNAETNTLSKWQDKFNNWIEMIKKECDFKAKKEARIKEIQQKFEAAKAKLQGFDNLSNEQKAANEEYKAAKAEFDKLQAKLNNAETNTLSKWQDKFNNWIEMIKKECDFKAKKEDKIKATQKELDKANAKLQEFATLSDADKAKNEGYKAVKKECDRLRAKLAKLSEIKWWDIIAKRAEKAKMLEEIEAAYDNALNELHSISKGKTQAELSNNPAYKAALEKFIECKAKYEKATQTLDEKFSRWIDEMWDKIFRRKPKVDSSRQEKEEVLEEV